MNENEKTLIKNLLDKSNRLVHSRAIRIAFYGIERRGVTIDNSFSRSCKQAVRQWFQGTLYFNREKELYDTFVELFSNHIINLGDTLLEIQNLSAWIYTAASNFCNSNRERINSILLIDDIPTVPLDSKYDKELDTDEEFDFDGKTEASVDEEDYSQAGSIGSDYEVEEILHDEEDDVSYDDQYIYDETEEDEDQDFSAYAKERLEGYFNMILASSKVKNAAKYVKILKDIFLDNHPHGSVKSTDLQNAKLQLIQVVLPEIRKTCGAQFALYGQQLSDDYQQALSAFFSNKPTDSTKVKAAYMALRVIANKEEKIRIKEKEKEERKQITKENRIKKYYE